MWWIWFVLLFSCRFGEASHPGPDDEFILGIANPTGLRNKAPFVVSQMAQGDIWTFSETHLCSKELRSFNAGLRFARSPFCPLVGGCPVPEGRDNVGRWRGVAVLSRAPVRHLPNDWPAEIAQSARVMAFTTMIDDAWVSGGIVYGEPDSQRYPNRLVHNEALLQAVVSSVCFLSKGPRFVAGDWNVQLGSLPVFATLHAAGFRDLQTLAEERWGIPPLPTCKNRTRCDFCFVSPELQQLLLHVEVIDDIWPDHAVVKGHFSRLRNIVPRSIWKKPAPFPWPVTFDVPADQWIQSHDSVSAKYQELWEAAEKSAAVQVPFSVPQKSFGRAQTRKVSSAHARGSPPLKVGRRGEFQPHFHGCSLRHAQWVRQVRRLQAYCRCVQASPEVTLHAARVWSSIRASTGFHAGFSSWWVQCEHKVHGSPLTLPIFPPPEDIALRIFETVAIAVRHLEAQLCSASVQYARMRRAQKPHLVFRDVQQSGPAPVDYLIRARRAQVVEVRPDECCVVVDVPTQWAPDRPICCEGCSLSVIHAEHDALWLDDLSFVSVGSNIIQVQSEGTKAELEALFCAEWRRRWDRHKDVPHSRRTVILDFARQYLPRGSFSWPSLTPSTLRQAILAKKPTAAPGLDGVTLSDLHRMPSSVLSNFCAMFAEAERTGQWPRQLVQGKVACLAKIPQPESVLDFRPITIFGLLYRVWGSYHARHGIRALDPLLPDSLFGSRPACFAGQVWSQLLWAIEHSHSEGIHLAGLVADLQKAFNHLPRLVILESLAHLGIPLSVLVGWAGALAQMARHFLLGDHLTAGVFSSTGLPEGDGLSCLGMIAVDFLFHE